MAGTDIAGMLEWRCIGPHRGGRVVAVAEKVWEEDLLFFVEVEQDVVVVEREERLRLVAACGRIGPRCFDQLARVGERVVMVVRERDESVVSLGHPRVPFGSCGLLLGATYVFRAPKPRAERPGTDGPSGPMDPLSF